jgi:translation initiation factor IF-2
MSSMRVYELANELGIESKETLSRCRELGIPVKSHMSIIEDEDIQKLKKHLKEHARKAASEKIEEKRVGSTVIRRRAVKQAEKAEPTPPPKAEVPEKKAPPGKKAVQREKKEAKVKKKKTEEKPPQAETEIEAKPETPPREIPRVRATPLRPYAEPVGTEKKAEAKEASSTEVEVMKKKKKGKAAASVNEMEMPAARKKGKASQPPVKKGLRRKITFKSQRGASLDGMELIDMERMYIPARKKPVGKKYAPKKTKVTVPKEIKRQVRMGDKVSVSDLARRMGVKAPDMIKKMSEQGITAQHDTELDYDTASLIAGEFNYNVIQERFEEAEILAFPKREKEEKLVPRPPVVTLMGHVDHGKTSLLDYIRKTRVAEQEAGGITQHIGASVIEIPQGQITFLDTPGHEAFTAMRARGARVTDIVVLVVAADDGVMPQTREAVNHSRAAGVPILVAINKIDLPDANVEGVMTKLTELGLLPEEFGGETLVVNTSAKTGQGIDDLLEAILLQAEMLELKGDPDRSAEAVVIESRLDKGKGPVCSVIIQHGTLHVGAPVICGNFSGKIRAMLNDKGQMVKEAGLSYPVEIVGLSGVPNPGDRLLAVEDERKAKVVSEHRKEQHRQSTLTAPVKASLEDLLEMAKKGEKPRLNIIIKADTNGSVEAVKEVLNKVFTDKVELDIIHTGVGGITENDVLLASASQAIVIGFMVRPESKAQKIAEKEDVELKLYQVIYDLGKDMEDRLKGLFKPEAKERVVGHAEVRQTFKVTRVGNVAGCYVSDGAISRNANARLLRDHVVIHEGKIASLKRFKDDVREVTAGIECGLVLENYQDIKPGDIIEAYVMEEVQEE